MLQQLLLLLVERLYLSTTPIPNRSELHLVFLCFFVLRVIVLLFCLSSLCLSNELGFGSSVLCVGTPTVVVFFLLLLLLFCFV